MTERGAISELSAQADQLENMLLYYEENEPVGNAGAIECRKRAIEIAISALKEAQQYRKIGTVEECRETMERQKMKKPEQGAPFYWVDSVKVRGRYKEVRKKSYGHACPNCSESVAKLNGEYCNACGQRLDWSDNS